MSGTCEIHYSDGFGRCPFEIKVQNLESQLREANAKIAYKEKAIVKACGLVGAMEILLLTEGLTESQIINGNKLIKEFRNALEEKGE